MPYPPESTWNLPPTAEQIISINKALRILKRPEITERNRPETRWQARDLMKEVWDEVRDIPKVQATNVVLAGRRAMEKDNPGNLHKMRGELIRLKTDMENAAPELESIYRISLESAVQSAAACYLLDALNDYTYGIEMGKLIERRLGTGYGDRFMKIEDLAKEAIIEELEKNCSCKIQRYPEKEE